MSIIGFIGPAGVGKDTVAGWFLGKGFIKVALADPLKRLAARLFGFDVVQLWGPSARRSETSRIPDKGEFLRVAERFAKELPIDSRGKDAFMLLMSEWHYSLRLLVSAREALQYIGTEVGRQVDSEIWVKYLFHNVVSHLKDFDYNPALGLLPRVTSKDVPTGVVISDVRFKNEVEAVRSRGGKVFRLKREGFEVKDIGIAGHASEWEQASIPDSSLTGVLELPEGLEALNLYLTQEAAAGRFL